MHRPLLPALLSAAFSAAPLHAQLIEGTQVADINTAPAVVGSYSGGFASNGDLVYFNSVDLATGESYRIWRSDGTSAGTVQLSSIALNERESTFLENGDLFFAADELGAGVGLWRSDGTPAGTVEVFGALDWTDEPHDLVVQGGAVWFLAGLADSGTELWRHDLTTGQTGLFLEIEPGPESGVAHLFGGAAKVFFAGEGVTPIWATDGTPGGEVIVANVALGPWSGSIEHAVEIGSRVLFATAGSGTNPTGWWSSDGTPGGTFVLHPTFNTHWAVGGATKAYFTAGTVASTPLLWETDGTLAGTQAVTPQGGSNGHRVGFAPGVAIGDELFYSGLTASSGFELFRTNGAGSGVQLAADINPGDGSAPVELIEALGQVFFRADDGTHGKEIWKLDPTGGGASLVLDSVPGPLSGIVGSPPTILPAAHGVVFGQNFPVFGMEPAATDGVQSGMLLNVGAEGLSAGSNPTEFLRFGDRVLFQAFDEATGAELWISDGTDAGTQLVLDIDPNNDVAFQGAFGSFPRDLVQVGDRVYFYATHPDSGSELWSTDGTAAGTALVIDLIPGPASSEAFFFGTPVALGDALFFLAADPAGGSALWRADAAEVSKVVTTDPTGSSKFGVLAVVNDRLLFQATGPEGLELWSSDGTTAGSSLLADLVPGPESSLVNQIVVGDTVAYFTPLFGDELWKTDGTPAGTQHFYTQGPEEVGMSGLATLGDLLLFNVTTDATGREPWVSDGTAAGTKLLLDVEPGPGSGFPLGFTTAGDRSFFAVQSPPGSWHFGQLWMTDGTTAGTQLVADLPSPLAGAGVSDFWAPGSDRRLLFTNADANGEEWWVTDGTTTTPLADIAAGPKGSAPRPGTLVGNRLFFSASDGQHGTELHSMPFSATGGFAVTPVGQGCAGAAGVPELALAGGSASLGQSVDLGLANTLPAGLAFWFFDGALAPSAPAGECGVLLAAPKLLLSSTSDPSGEATLTLGVPTDPALVGATVDVQALTLELGGPFLGLGALSNALEIVVGP